MFDNITWFSSILLLVVLLAFYGIYKMQKKHVSYNKRVLIALGGGVLFGIILNILFYSIGDNESIWSNVNKAKSKSDIVAWLNLFGYGFIDLLRMLVIPLVFISIIAAILKIGKDNSQSFAKIMGIVIGVLMVTVAIAALIGVVVSNTFQLNANELVSNELCDTIVDNDGNPIKDAEGYNEDAYEACKYGYDREKRASSVKDLPTTLRSFIPANPIYALTNQDENSTIKTVVFAGFIGIALLGVRRKYPKEGERISDGIEATQKLIMRIVTLVLRLTPYGIFALIARQLAVNDLNVLLELGKFIGASYVALILVFIAQLVLLSVFKFNPITYIKKMMQPLMFGFISRSSAGTLPLTISAQKDKMGVSEGIANASSALGTSIGQNGCAGVYPAMLAVMIATSMGINTWDPIWIVTVILIVVIGSFGIAGVGGGATFAAIVVISALDYDLTLIGVLVAIEAFIDMARTAVNVSGSAVTGLITGKFTKQVDMKKYNDSSL